MKGHIYFIPNNSGRNENCSRKKTHKFKTSPRRIAVLRLLLYARQYNPSIPPYFCFSKHGTLCCCTLETLPPKVYSNSTRQSAGWREKRKKTQGKVGKSTNKNPENTTTTCGNWNRSHMQKGGLPASLRISASI